MKTLRIRSQLTVADPLQAERLLKALRIILEHQEAPNASRGTRTKSAREAIATHDRKELAIARRKSSIIGGGI